MLVNNGDCFRSTAQLPLGTLASTRFFNQSSARSCSWSCNWQLATSNCCSSSPVAITPHICNVASVFCPALRSILQVTLRQSICAAAAAAGEDSREGGEVKNQSKERCERKLNGKWLQDDISILEKRVPLDAGADGWWKGGREETHKLSTGDACA